MNNISIIRTSKIKEIKQIINTKYDYNDDDFDYENKNNIYEFNNKMAMGREGRQKIMPIQINKLMYALKCSGECNDDDDSIWDSIQFTIHIILKEIENTNNYNLKVIYYKRINNINGCPCCLSDEENEFIDLHNNEFVVITCNYIIFDINSNYIYKQLYKDITNSDLDKIHYSSFRSCLEYYHSDEQDLIEFDYEYLEKDEDYNYNYIINKNIMNPLTDGYFIRSDINGYYDDEYYNKVYYDNNKDILEYKKIYANVMNQLVCLPSIGILYFESLNHFKKYI